MAKVNVRKGDVLVEYNKPLKEEFYATASPCWWKVYYKNNLLSKKRLVSKFRDFSDAMYFVKFKNKELAE